METRMPNITDKDPGERMNFFITSLFSQNFFYHYEFFANKPSNVYLKDNVEVKWWFPDILFSYDEPVNRFELFKRRMKFGYSKFGESLVSAITILPSDFNNLESDVDIDATYGDKIVVLTPKLAKLYYIISKVEEANEQQNIVENFVIIIFVHENSVTGELYKVGNKEFYLLERTEKIVPHLINEIKSDKSEKVANEVQSESAKVAVDKNLSIYPIIESVQKQLSQKIDVEKNKKPAFTIIFRENKNLDKLDPVKLQGSFIIDEIKTENEILKDGALFKAKSDYEGNCITFVDNTSRLPFFKIVYPLLRPASDYRPMTDAFGIDLGTSRSALAVHRFIDIGYDLNIIRDAFDPGTLLYSWVAYDTKEINPICGRTVYDRFGARADYIIFDCKKIIGKRLDEIEQNKEWKFKLFENGDSVKIQVKRKDDNVKEGIDIFVTPEEVYKIMLDRFKTNSLKTTKINLEKAVFTIPSNFTQKQKNAMREAAKMANIEVLRFLPEPTAAVLSYCARIIEKPANNDLIFVFDLGGGTFDISIFKVENSKLIELCQHSNLDLGATNFNKVLYNDFVKKLKEEHGIEIGEKRHDLWIKCTNAKEELTTLEETNINIDATDIDYVITRDNFEDLCHPLIDDIKESINFSLNKANVKAADITYVIKVGGSCEMPMIESLIKDTFANSKFKNSDPQHEVAFGAALYASSILPQKKMPSNFIKNYWPL